MNDHLIFTLRCKYLDALERPNTLFVAVWPPTLVLYFSRHARRDRLLLCDRVKHMQPCEAWGCCMTT